MTRREVLAASGAALLAAGCEPRGGAGVPEALLGPLVGHTTDTTTALWVAAEPRSSLSVRWRRASDAAGAAQDLAPLEADPHNAAVYRRTLTGLVPDTRYVYRVFWNEHTEEGWAGSLRTARAPSAPGLTRIGVSSCMKPKFPGTSFELMRLEQPHFHLLLGDNAYSDSTRREVIWQAHREMRSVPQLAALLRHVPTYAIWDDHDYGGDDVDGTLEGKHRSLACFRDLFANPGYGLPEVPGIFSRFLWGDVEVFLLDVRFHRSPGKSPDGPEKRVLGAAQFEWLATGLAASKAPFKLICSGSVLEAHESDTWRDYPTDRARLFAMLAERKVSGVVFLTGDLHRCLVQLHPPELTGTYAIPEVISSGIANSQHLGFAMLDIDTRPADPTLGVRIIEREGRVTHQQTILASDLQAH